MGLVGFKRQFYNKQNKGDRMKTATIAIIMLLCISFASAAIIYFPLPINGKLMGVNVDNRIVQVENTRTGKIMTATTNGAGEYLVDWANSDDNGGAIIKYQGGDTFKITVMACSNSAECITTITYTGQPEIKHNFDLNNVVLTCPDCPDCPSCSGGGGGSCYINEVTAEKCAEAFPCTAETCKETDCPICQETECPACTDEECEKFSCPPTNCPENDITGWLTALITFLIGGGAAYISLGNNRIKVKKVDGKDEVQHRHPSISGYHSPNTKHRSEAHAIGELLPKYEKDSTGKWKYVGGK